MAAPFDLIEEAKRLIRFNTVTWSSNLDCAVYIGSLFRKAGLEVVYQEQREGELIFMNVAGVLGSGKKPLLLTTHLDTVDSGDPKLWTKTGADPWSMTLRGDAIYGLGVADTKLDLLCKLSALCAVDRKKIKRPAVLLGTFGEESGLRGAARFCQGDFPKPEMALVGEPTQLELVTRHKGLSVAEVLFKNKGLYRPNSAEWVYDAVFTGQASHSSTPDLGINALEASRRFLENLKRKYKKVHVLLWEAGTGHNVIPASARLRFSLGEQAKVVFSSGAKQKIRVERLPAGWYPKLPWENMCWCMETIRDLLIPFEKERDSDFVPPQMTWNLTWLRETKEGWSLTFDARSLPGKPIHKAIRGFEKKLWDKLGHPGPDWQFHLERDNPALELERKAPLVKLALSAMKSAKLPAKVKAKSGCTEAGLYSRVGIPSVVIGPGRSAGNIHRPNEANSVRQLKAAIRFYKTFMEKACS